MTEPRAEVLRLRSDALTWREIEGEVVLLDLRASIYVSVNASGSTLWKLLAGGATRGELVSALMSSFGVEEAHAAADVDAFVLSCRERGLLEH